MKIHYRAKNNIGEIISFCGQTHLDTGAVDTEDKSEVTCGHCLKRIEKMEQSTRDFLWEHEYRCK